VRLIPRRREGRCYELAFRYLRSDERYEKGWDLVHGEIDSGDGPIGHAWLVRQDGEMIYDPVLGEEFATATYWLRFDVAEKRRFSGGEAARCLVKFGHYGPWPLQAPTT
jgi:hypothetical protein